MAARRGQEEEGYSYKENPYLTPGQELLEASAMANPFLGSSSGFGPLSQRSLEAEAAYEEQASRLPNAMLAPPQGLSSLPLEKQMAWRENLAKEAQLDAQLLASESNRRRQELEDISRREGLELIKRSADLNPTRPEYPAQKAALIRQFPGGANSEEAKVIFSDLDSRRKTVESAEQEEKKAREGAERTRGENNFTVARTEASSLGPEFLGNFLEISKAQGPDAAIAYVTREGARSKEAGLRSQLESQGLTPQEVTERYGGGARIPLAEGLVAPTPFQFPAAEEAAKGKNIAELRRQARQERTDLMRIRAQAYAQGGKQEAVQWATAGRQQRSRCWRRPMRDTTISLVAG